LYKRGERALATPPAYVWGLMPSHAFLAWAAMIDELGVLAAISNDDRYLRHAELLVRFVQEDIWPSGTLNERHLQVPFMVGALAGFCDLHADRSDDGAFGRAHDLLIVMSTHLHNELVTRPWGSRARAIWNHNIIGYATLGLAALALVDHPPASVWLHLALERSRYFLSVGVTQAGMTWEGIGYCGLVLKHLGPLVHAVHRLDCETQVLARDTEARWRRIPVWYAHSVFPRGRHMQNFNDAHWDPNLSLQGFLASFARERPRLSARIWDRLLGASGRANYGVHRQWPSVAEATMHYPPARSVIDDIADESTLHHVFVCADIGFVHARDQWNDEASVLGFNCGPFIGRIHDQSDNNSMTFIARGVPLVIDGGAANERVEGSPSSSLGHNLVFIDGRAQRVSGEGSGVSGALVGVREYDDAIAVAGDARASYCVDEYNPVEHAIRHAVFVKRPLPYLLTMDDIRKDSEEHFYEYVVHVPSGRCPRGEEVEMLPIVVDGHVCGRMELLNPASAYAAGQPFRSRSGPFRQHVVWRLGTRAVNPEFVVLFLPLAGAEAQAARRRIRRHRSALHVSLRWPWGIDTFVFPVVTRRRPASQVTTAHFSRRLR
jgi:hypothetical protein